MRDADIRAFTRRDWRAAERSKAAWWAESRRRQGPLEALHAADAMLRLIRTLRPDWPGEAERRADLEAHERLAERFARVAAALGR